MSPDFIPLSDRDLNDAAPKISLKEFLLEEDRPPCGLTDQRQRLISFSLYVLTSISLLPSTLIKRLVDASLTRAFL